MRITASIWRNNLYMKKALLTTSVFVLITSIAQAQITKGRTLLGGSISYGQGNNESTGNSSYPAKQHNLFVNPSVGKVIKDNLVVGLEGSFYSGNQKYGNTANESVNKSRSYGASLFVRQYVPLLKRFYFYAQALAGGGKNKAEQTYNNQTYSTTEGWGASVSLNPGLTYAITKKLYVESALNGFALLAYGHSKSEATDPSTGTVSTSKSNTFNFTTSLGGGNGFSVGFRLLL
jgi:hypothetical protein